MENNKNLKILTPGGKTTGPQIIKPTTKEEIAKAVTEIKFSTAQYLQQFKATYEKYVEKAPHLVNVIETIKDAIMDLDNVATKGDIEKIDIVIAMSFNEIAQTLNGFVLIDTIDTMIEVGKAKTMTETESGTLESICDENRRG